jgi:putative ATPase
MPKATPLFRTEKKIPLAARMRPRTLDEFVGQEHITGPGKVSRQAIESLILWGPAGTGQNSLVIAKSHFQSLSAVLAGVKDLQRIIEGAKARHTAFGQRTILLVKAQQDALLPHVEDGRLRKSNAEKMRRLKCSEQK